MATERGADRDEGSRTSRAFLLRGALAILFGLAVVIAPGMSALAIVALFGAYAFVDGAVAFGEAIQLRRAGARSWPSFVEGALGVALAALALARPEAPARDRPSGARRDGGDRVPGVRDRVGGESVFGRDRAVVAVRGVCVCVRRVLRGARAVDARGGALAAARADDGACRRCDCRVGIGCARRRGGCAVADAPVRRAAARRDAAGSRRGCRSSAPRSG